MASTLASTLAFFDFEEGALAGGGLAGATTARDVAPEEEAGETEAGETEAQVSSHLGRATVDALNAQWMKASPS